MWRNFYVYACVILFFIQFISLATSINTDKDASFTKGSESQPVIPLHDDGDYDQEPDHDVYSKETTDGGKDDDDDRDYEDEYENEDEIDGEADRETDRDTIQKQFGLPLKEDNDGAGDNEEDDESEDERIRLLYDFKKKLPKLKGYPEFGKIDSISTTPPTSTTPKTTTSTPSDVSVSCPKGCSCLGDFMDCIRQNLNEVPPVPDWVQTL